MPIITMWAPPGPMPALAFDSASFRLARISSSRSTLVRPDSGRGGTLNSML
ncbi:Uncharacterised protein [Mycobacterium tuberculosis]|nr:Uncharacterised protein [Mycobacterium tuberculosis]